MPSRLTPFSFVAVLLASWMAVGAAQAQWVNFFDETGTRLALINVTQSDDREKDIAIGDLDRDGDDDIVVVRKAPFAEVGGEADVLLMNESGVFIDRTTTLAPSFLSDLTDARDVAIADFDGDLWPDVIIANANGQQPSLYINKGEAGGTWRGLSPAPPSRLPTLTIPGGPNFSSVTVASFDGDADLDLYFSSYADDGSTTTDILLENNGNANFTDVTGTQLDLMANAAFNSASAFADFNGDLSPDIVKISSLYPVSPWNGLGTYVLYNDGGGDYTAGFQDLGISDAIMLIPAHLNADSLLDMYVVRDFQDEVALNLGGSGQAAFSVQPVSSARTDAFGGNVKAADIDMDGDLDVGVCPIDLEISNCAGAQSSTFALLQNDGAGGFTDPYDSGDQNFHLRPHDFAFVDVDGDSITDIFMALCTGYAVFRQDQAIDTPEITIAPSLALSVLPNPSRDLTRFSLGIVQPTNERVHVEIFDVRGARVRTVFDGPATQLPGELTWDGRTDDGRRVPSGAYFARARYAGLDQKTKIIRLR